MATENGWTAMTEKQREWVYAYQDRMGFDPYGLFDLETGELSFDDFTAYNLDCLRSRLRELENMALEARP